MTRFIQLAVLLSAFSASAQIPKTLSFQGYLTDKASGNPVGGSTDVTRNMSFAIYDAFTDGTQLWSESHNDVIVSKGLYHVILGSNGSPLTLSFNQTYYLQVSIEGEVFDKRIEITSSAYSISSINTTNTSFNQNISTTGRIAIGHSNPALQDTDLDIRSIGPDVATSISLANSDLSHKLAFYPGRQNDPLPFILWKSGDPLRFSTDEGGFRELFRFASSGALGVGSSSNFGISGQVLTSAGSAAAPNWSTISATNITTGTLPVAQVPSLDASKITTGILPIGRGGTNATTAADARTSLGLVIGTNVQAYDDDLDDLADGSLAGNKVGTGINATNITTGTLPVTQVPDLNTSKITAGTLPIVRGGTNSIATPTNGGIAYGTGTAFAFTAAGTAGQLLQSNGAIAPTWVNNPVKVVGSNNIGVGTDALISITTGTYNTANGYQALYSNTTGSYNTAIGNRALHYTTGDSNTGIGSSALFNNSTGIGNTATGTGALFSNQTGQSNTANGGASLYSNTIGVANTGSGDFALYSNMIGHNNTAIGSSALFSNVAGSSATAIGFRAMQYASNTTTAFENYNVAVGFEALRGSTTASANTGNYNTALGRETLMNNTTGEKNTALGSGALLSNTVGNDNTASGSDALRVSSGNNNSALGRSALFSNTSGSGNTALGRGALLTNTIGNNNTAIGYNANVSVNNLTNATAIGANAVVSTSNSLVLGNTANVGIGESSPSYLLDIKTTVASTAMRINKTGSAAAQEYVVFSRNGVSIGNITANASDAMSYNAFTGSHYAYTIEPLLVGELVTMTGENHVLNNSPEGEPIYGITKSYVANDPRILGSFFQPLPTDTHKGNPEIKLIMAVGNGEMWVSNNGVDIKAGDYLISSHVKGHAMKDVGLYEVSYVIARAAENVNWEQVTETVEGTKHKKISVFFENFMYNNRAEKLALELNEVKAALEKLKSEIEALNSKTLQTSNNTKIDP